MDVFLELFLLAAVSSFLLKKDRKDAALIRARDEISG